MRHQTQQSASILDDELDEVFGRANPNPERVGCPSREVLSALARKQRPIEDPAYQHLAECSECYIDVRALQKSSASTAHAFGNVARRVMAAAAIVLVAGSAAWLLAPARDGLLDPDDSISQGSTAVPIELDLRNYAIERGEPTPSIQGQLVLPRGRLKVTILLPVGSEAGGYELELVDAAQQSRTSATGVGTMRDFVTKLQTEFDLRGLRPGSYQLGVRRQDEDWRFFAAQVR